MLRMITLLPGRVVEPSCRPPPVISAVAPTPMMLLSATTVIMSSTVIRPLTRIVYGEFVPAYCSSAAPVVTVTVGPAAPPVVPLRPSALTLAKPSAEAAAAAFPVPGARIAAPSTATTRSSRLMVVTPSRCRHPPARSWVRSTRCPPCRRRRSADP
jgi:hypothetical protein